MRRKGRTPGTLTHHNSNRTFHKVDWAVRLPFTIFFDLMPKLLLALHSAGSCTDGIDENSGISPSTIATA